MYKLSTDSRIGQLIILSFSILMLTFSIPFYFIANNILLPSAILLVSLFSNWIASRSQFIYIKEGNFHVENLYKKKKTIKGELFSELEQVMPSRETYYLCFSDGQRLSFSKHDYRNFFKGDKAMVDQLTKEIRQALTSTKV